MKKSELKSGMMIRCDKEEEFRLVMLNTKIGDSICDLAPDNCNVGGFRHYNFFPLNWFDEDLKIVSKTSPVRDIIEVKSMYGELLYDRSKEEEVLKKESNLDYAKRMYGKGVIFKSMIDPDKVFESMGEFSEAGDQVMSVRIKSTETIHACWAWIWIGGSNKWAEIESNLDKAKRLYGNGVNFISPMTGDRFISSGIDFKEDDEGNIRVRAVKPYFFPYIFCNGQWSIIVEKPETKESVTPEPMVININIDSLFPAHLKIDNDLNNSDGLSDKIKEMLIKAIEESATLFHKTVEQ